MNRLALTAVLTLAACTASTLGLDDSLRLDFESRREDSGQYRPQPAVTAAGGAGEVVVEARLSAPSPCQKLAAGARSADGRTVELEVRILPDAPVCIAVIGNYAYTARVRGLAPGAYTVRVRHLYPGTGWTSGTVLETPVTVH